MDARLARKKSRKNKATRRVWYEKNAERVRAKGRSYRRAWYAKNQLKAKASVAEYRRLNRDSVRAALRNNKARRKGAEGRHTKHDIAALMKTQRSRCAHPWCKRSLKAAYHIDHVMPIALGGSMIVLIFSCFARLAIFASAPNTR